MSDLIVRLQPRFEGLFTLERELGRGGMATVFAARDVRSGQTVALKVLDQVFATTVSAERFEREIRIARELAHPNIVPLLDSGMAGDLPWFAMPIIAGESLQTRLHRERQLRFDDAIAIGRQVAVALDHAHLAGIVHRDVKPANILLHDDRAWLSDFGIARIVIGDAKPLTSKSVIIGTPHYMSPEQARAEHSTIDGRSDIYSLGCVMYELLAGEPPFNAKTADAVIARHRSDPVPSITTLRQTAGPAVQEVFEKILAKSAADRYATAIEAVDALERALQVKGRTNRRRWMVAGVAAVAAVAAMLVLQGQRSGLDSRRVVILPMEVVGTGQFTGEDAATALANTLNTTDSIMATVADRLPGDASTWTDAVLADLGRARHARYLIQGEVRRDSVLRIELTFRDIASGSVAHRTLDAPAEGDAFAVARRIARTVLPGLLPPGGTAVDERLLSSDVPALSAYLEGERAYRRGNFALADSQFSRAVSRDSSFAWAALRGAQAASWLTERTRAAAYLRVAEPGMRSLPPRYAKFARGLSAYLRGQADSAALEIRAALALDHRWAEAHMMLGEIHHHYIPAGGYPLDVARASFDSAMIFDPGFAAPLFHAVQHAVWRGERNRADSLHRRFAAIVTQSTGEREQLALMMDCVQGSANRARWVQALGRSVGSAVQAATWLTAGGLRYPDCVTVGFQAVLDREGVDFTWAYYAAMELAFVNASLGRPSEVRSALARLGPGGSTDLLTIMLATAGVPIRGLADSALARLRADPVSAERPNRRWAAATWAIAQGDTVAGRELANATDFGDTPQFRASIEARIALARGDTVLAIRSLRRTAATADQATLRWSPWEVLPWERFKLAELLMATSQFREAAIVASELDSPTSFGFVPWLAPSLRLREQAERRLGDQAYANELRARYVVLTKADSLANNSIKR